MRLAPPPLRDGLVPRAGLAERLRPGVVSVVAPPGYGKTTLLAEVAASVPGRPLVWITADGDDGELTSVLEVPAGPLCVVIDDAHLLPGLDAVVPLAERLPARSHLLLASRVPLPDLGGAELGAEDLRMSDAEAAQLVRGTGVEATDDEIADLNARLEGWPAGLYLAALALESEGQPLSEFGGWDRFVREYVRAECLAGLADEDVRFLLHCSALDELAGPVCDGAFGASRSAARLRRLAGSNLFLVPLGPGRFRFQPVFREALTAELHRDDPALAAAIAARAADWCEQKGDLAGTVEYAWAAGERDRFAELVEGAAPALYRDGAIEMLERWLERLDDRLLGGHPELAVWASFVHAVRGRAAAAERLLEAAELASAPADRLAVLRAALGHGGAARMGTYAVLALDTLADESAWRPVAQVLLGAARLLEGAPDADSPLEAAGAGPPDLACLALALRTARALDDGDRPAAEALVARTRTILQEHALDSYPTTALAHAAGARLAVSASDWVRAHGELERADTHLPALTAALPWLSVHTRLELARVRLELSDHAAAAALLADAEDLLAPGTVPAWPAERVEALRRELGPGAQRGETWGRLTAAELRLLPWLTTHLSFREIADVLHVSRNTVKTQAICVYRKLGVSSRSAAIDRAGELGLVERPVVLDAADPAPHSYR